MRREADDASADGTRALKPWIGAALAWVLATPLVAAPSFSVGLVLAGPHGGVLPAWLGTPTLLAAWAVTVGVPIVIGRAVHRRIDRRSRPRTSTPERLVPGGD